MGPHRVDPRNVVGAVASLLILVAGSTVGAGVLSASLGVPSSGIGGAPFGSLPKTVEPAAGARAPSSDAPLAWVTPALLKGLAASRMADEVAQVPDSVFDEGAAVLRADAKYSGVATFGFPDQAKMATALGAAAVVIAVVCISAGTVTLGIACLAAILAVAVALVLNYLFNTNAFGQPTVNWQSVANNLVLASYQRYQQQADDAAQILQFVNLSYNALAYEASASALSQLGNSSFSTALDLAQSGVAKQLSSVLFQDEFELAQIYTTTMEDANLVMGSQNTAGSFCYLSSVGSNLNGATADQITAPSGSGPCPVSGSSTTYAYYAAYPSTDAIIASALSAPTSCPAVWLVHGGALTASSSTSGANGITLIPVDAVTAHPSRNVSLNWTGTYAAAAANVSFSGPSDSYYVCSSHAPASTETLYPSYLFFPLTATVASSANMVLLGLASSDPASEKPNDAQVLGQSICAGTTSNCAGLLGSESGLATHPSRGGQVHEIGSLFLAAQFAANTAQSYWGFLRSLGYTSASQVPLNCVIPTPDAAFSQGFDTNQLATLNSTQITEAYDAFWLNLASSFNASTTLTSFNFCGKHVAFNFGNTTFPLNSYALGYVYVPSASHTSNGSGTQIFGDPTTWNLSGYIYLAPNVAPITVTLNTTWLLPNASANTFVLWDQPFTRTASNWTTNPVVNRMGPTECYLTPPTTSPFGSGCNTTVALLHMSSIQSGNSTSTNPSGSAYPTAKGATAGLSVYLKFCIQTSANFDPFHPSYVVHPVTCSFNHTTITDVTTNTGCPPNCPSGIVNPFSACGQTFPIWAEAVGFWAGFTGTSSLGCLAAEALAAITILILVVVIAYIAVGIVGFIRRDR